MILTLITKIEAIRIPGKKPLWRCFLTGPGGARLTTEVTAQQLRSYRLFQKTVGDKYNLFFFLGDGHGGGSQSEWDDYLATLFAKRNGSVTS